MDKSSLVNSDTNHCISTLAYIFQLEPDLLLPIELDHVLLDAYESLKGANLLYHLRNVVRLCKFMEMERYVIINEQFIIYRNRWFCKLVILASLKHCGLLLKDNCDIIEKKMILHQVLATFHPERSQSIHLLQLMVKLVDLLRCNLDLPISINLINVARTVASSPVTGFKRYAETISKSAWNYLSTHHTEFLDVDLLPLRGIATSEVQFYFRSLDTNCPLFQGIVTRIIEMFSNNIENREGGILYRILLNMIQDNFSLWEVLVWPQFFRKFQMIDCESEFFQSLLKYWIPITVTLYQGYILLETRRRFRLKTFQEDDLEFLHVLFSQNHTRLLALQIVGCPFRKGILPSIAEMLFVRQFLDEQGGALTREEMQALHRFVTQIGTVIANVKAEEEYLKYLKIYLNKLFTFGVSLFRTNRRRLGAQVLATLCDGIIKENTPSLKVLTQSEPEKRPKEECLRVLKLLKSDGFVDLVEQVLLESKGSDAEFSELASKIIEVPKLFTNEFLMVFIDEASSALSINAAESVKNITSFVTSVSSKEKINNLHDSISAALMTLFENEWSVNMDSQDIFKASLLFDALNQVCCHITDEAVSKRVYTMCFPTVAGMLQQKYYQPKQDSLVELEQWLNTKNKTEKIVEALYNNLCQYIMKMLPTWTCVDQPEMLMDTLVRVIEHSSMRKPTMLSGDLLKRVAMLTNLEVIKQHNLANFKVELLYHTLWKLEQAAPKQNLTIRRNPESRLVLHALCLSDASEQKPFLTWTLSHLLDLLSDAASTDASASAALHCTEILMSDNALHGHTLKHAPRVILACVRHFRNRNWIVRNASIQLAKALIDRFLGVQIGRNKRAKSVEDLFELFPHIALPFCQILTQEPLTDSALLVMQFFSESQLKKHPCFADSSAAIRAAFLSSFVGLIKHNSDLYGLFAARAYASLCLEQDIPSIVQHIVDFVVHDFEGIRSKHTLRNFMLLLHELHDKYMDSMSGKPAKPSGFYEIQASLHYVTTFLSHCDSKQFDCLLVKVLPVARALGILQTTKFESNDHRQRLWLHNYVPFLVINTPVGDLPGVLQAILSKDVPDCVQVKVLSVLVDRFAKEDRFRCEASAVLSVLVRQALAVKTTSKHYVLMCYFKVILLLFDEASAFDAIPLCHDEYLSDTYKMFIFLLVLTRVKAKTDADKAFVKSAVKRFQALCFTDDDFTENVSEMLQHLYRNVSCLCDRRRILKLALLLILEHGLWHFPSFITKSSIPGPTRALQKMLNFHFLTSFFGSDVLAYEFVDEFYRAACLDTGPAHKSDHSETYYVEEECVFVSRDSIGRIVSKFLYDLCKTRKMNDWLEYYSKIRDGNKINLL